MKLIIERYKFSQENKMNHLFILYKGKFSVHRLVPISQSFKQYREIIRSMKQSLTKAYYKERSGLNLKSYLLLPKENQQIISTVIKRAFTKYFTEGHSIGVCWRKTLNETHYQIKVIKHCVMESEFLAANIKQRNLQNSKSRKLCFISSYLKPRLGEND